MSFASGWLQPLNEDWPSAAVRLLTGTYRPPSAQLDWIPAAQPVHNVATRPGAAALVRVMVAAMRGSAPREPGTCMLVSEDTVLGTIGGGHLEEEALRTARSLLRAADAAPVVHIRQLTLGRDLRQCCGGAVQLWLERFTHDDLRLLEAAAHAARATDSAVLETNFDGKRVTRWLIDADAPESARLLKSIASSLPQPAPAPELEGIARVKFTQTSGRAGTLLERLSMPRSPLLVFGAGHVGQAAVRVLHELAYDITWVDSRAGLLPADLPGRIRARQVSDPVKVIQDAPPGALYLVLTHDHALDYALCAAVLRRGDSAWLGLIGSESKAARFRSRLRREGVAPQAIARLVCPIGIDGIRSKQPAAIAVSVAAQLLQLSQAAAAQAPPAARMLRIVVSNEPCGGEGGESCESCRPQPRSKPK